MEKMGKYELIRKLASGGMAEVFLARAAGPMGFEKKLVVKRILPHLVEEPQFVEMFLSEAKLAAQLNHPNIVQIFDFGDADGTYFLAMEHIDGPNLRVLSARACERGTPIPFPLCAKIISCACEALTYAHDSVDAETGAPLHLIHRDISPDNILLARNGAVKVVDFGIAKAATQLHRTKTGWVKGKIAYMSPEQLKGEPLDRRADVFALGVVLYELVTAQKPYDADSEVTLMHAILYESIVPVKTRRPDVPKELERIVHKALAKDREQRYPNCRELQVDLDRFLLDMGEAVGAFELSKLVVDLHAGPEALPARRNRSGAATAMAKGQARPSFEATVQFPQGEAGREPRGNAGPDAPSEVSAFHAGARRRRVGLIALVSGALLLLGGAGAFWWRGKAPPPALVQAPAAPVAQEPPTRAPVKPPEPEPEQQLQPAEAPRQAPAAPKLASLKIISEPPAHVRIGSKRGKSPFTAAVQPGEVEVEVYDKERGFSKTARFNLKAGSNEVQKVVVGKGFLVLRSVPYANVFLDGRALGETPLEQVEAYEGKHTVKFVCPKLDQEDIQEIELAPGEKKIVKARYP